jgi:hypothetical protein
MIANALDDVQVADVVVASAGEELSFSGVVEAWLSFAGASTITVRVLAEVKPFWSVAT